MTDQTAAYMADLQSVIDGSKPAVIIERRKSRKAYLAAMPAAIKHGLTTQQMTLADSTGKRLPAIMLSRDSKTLTRIVKLLARRDRYPRDSFQITMGTLLGYPVEDCIEYTASKLSRTCGCQLCGGPTPESRLDDEARAKRLHYCA